MESAGDGELLLLAVDPKFRRQGIGWALYEDFVFQDGRLVNGNFADYTMATADAAPELRHAIVESIDPNGPFGAKGASETAIVPTAGAIANAVYKASGKRVRDLPIAEFDTWLIVPRQGK